ncbi:MAG: hypothetical protein K2H96_00290 [Muribaculaceae bacterium]|nr:hypothetical protein [Muribaculaceae bacterium]
MTVSIDEIVESVLVRLDESPAVLDDAVEYGSPWFDLRALIRSVMVEASERVILTADSCDFGEWLPLSGVAVKMGTQDISSGSILRLPDDFMRLVYIRMSDWSENVTRIADSRDVAVSLRRHWLRRGGANHNTLAVALTYHDGGRALEIFGSATGSSVEEGGYIPRPRLQDNEMLFPPSLKGSLIDKIVEIIKAIRG